MPEEPTPPSPKPAADLHGLDPGELLARGLHTVKASAGSGPWEPPTPEVLAKLLPQYRIESLLGRGGMGAVYKGVQPSLDRPVAIKLLPAELATDADFIARFQREARTLAKLQHSGIVAVYDFGQTSEGHLYFVMEYVDGTDLQHILKGPGLKPEQALELIGQICDALYAAHKQGVIHRDIKPANILLTKDGRAKLADFGLARPLTEDSGGLTMTNMIMGTPDYMAPEQRTSATHADHRADIFALGVMLYEMLTGQRPHGAFQPASQRVQVDVRIDEVVLKALQQEPARRYQQASEMKQDVERIRTTPPTPAKPKRSKLLVAAAVIISIIVALISVPILTYFLAKGPAAPSVESSPKSSPDAAAKSDLPWQRVERPDAEWKADGFAVHGGWAEYGASDGKDKRWAIHDTANERPEQLRDVAVRARFRWVDGTGSGGSGARISLRARTGTNNVEAMAELWKDQLRVVFPPQQRYPMAPLRKPLQTGQEGLLEMAVIKNRVIVRLDGSVMLDESDPKLTPFGGLIISSRHCWLRDIEYAKLDGLADPLKALGWEVAAGAASASAGVTPSEAVLKARNNGGKLMIWGKTRRGPATLGGAAAFDDFVQVAAEADGWAARRAGNQETWLAASAASLSVKDVPFSVRGRSLSRAGLIAVLDGKSGAYRDPIYFDGAVTEPKAITLLKTDGSALWLGADGTILASKKWKEGIKPPDDFFAGATAFTASAENFFTARKAANVESWNSRTGQKHAFPLRSEVVLEMDAAADFVAILTKDGQARLFMDDGRPLRSADPRLTKAPSDSRPFVAIRAGRGMVAAQKPDGSWVAWGELDALAQKVAGLGHVIDLDFDYDPKGGELLIWIEPVDGSAAATPAPANPQAAAEAKKRLVEARAHLKAGDAAETLELVQAAMQIAPEDPGAVAEAALLYAEAQSPERALTLAHKFAGLAPAEHPQFAAIAELRVKLGPTMKQYRARLDDAAKLVTANDDAGELRELKAALALVPDGKQAADKLAANPLHVGRPVPGRRFTHELGHTFVPVDGLANVLFSTWETRVKDFEAFVKETGYDMSQPRADKDKSLTWRQPGFSQTPDDPVVMVTREDANVFCRWLTTRERAAGRLLPGQEYRLPTDREWSAAMGVLNEPGDFPEDRRFPEDALPWKKGTEPPRNTANLNWKNDDFANTAPVGRSVPNRFGLYDMIGNVREMCMGPWSFHAGNNIVRGGSFNGRAEDSSRSWLNDAVGAVDRSQSDAGFRCVIDLKSEEHRQVQIALEDVLKQLDEPMRKVVQTLVNDEMVLLDFRPGDYLTDQLLRKFSAIPVTHLFGVGGGLRGATDTMKPWPLRVVNLNTLFIEEDFLESFRGLPLQWVRLMVHPHANMAVKTLDPLAGMKLKGLSLDGFNLLQSVEPLRGMPLEELHLKGVFGSAVDLSPLQAAPLRKITVPRSISLDQLLRAGGWWGLKAQTFEGPRMEIMEGFLREAALTGDPAKVATVKPILKAKFANAPSCKPWIVDVDGKSYAQAEEYCTRAARFLGGDAAAFDGQFQTFQGHSYLWCNQWQTFDEAKAFAAKLGGHVVTITSEEENDFIIQQLEAGTFKRDCTLGLERTGEGRMAWKWVTGEPLEYHNWGPESGAGADGAVFVQEKGQWLWFHHSRGNVRPFIIEWDTPTPQPPLAAAQ